MLYLYVVNCVSFSMCTISSTLSLASIYDVSIDLVTQPRTTSAHELIDVTTDFKRPAFELLAAIVRPLQETPHLSHAVLFVGSRFGIRTRGEGMGGRNLNLFVLFSALRLLPKRAGNALSPLAARWLCPDFH